MTSKKEEFCKVRKELTIKGKIDQFDRTKERLLVKRCNEVNRHTASREKIFATVGGFVSRTYKEPNVQ